MLLTKTGGGIRFVIPPSFAGSIHAIPLLVANQSTPEEDSTSEGSGHRSSANPGSPSSKSNRSADTPYSESFSHFFNSSAGTRMTPDVPFAQSSPASVSTKPETLPGLRSSFQCISWKRPCEKRTTPPAPPSQIWSRRTATTATEISRFPSGKEKRWYALPSHSTNLFENANHMFPLESPAIAPMTPGFLPRASVTLVHVVPTRWYESGVRVVIMAHGFDPRLYQLHFEYLQAEIPPAKDRLP